jgi:hypothetical protein
MAGATQRPPASAHAAHQFGSVASTYLAQLYAGFQGVGKLTQQSPEVNPLLGLEVDGKIAVSMLYSAERAS